MNEKLLGMEEIDSQLPRTHPPADVTEQQINAA
jgi:hypothetical protein